MMSRFIDVNLLIHETEESMKNNPHKSKDQRAMHVHEHRHFITMVSRQPIVDAVSVVHGRWIENKVPNGVEVFGHKEMMIDSFVCSVCGRVVDVSEGDSNYCPNCGAKMDLEEG